MIGVLAGPSGSERIGARKVILACDGFGANREMLERYIPEMAGVEYVGTKNNTGEARPACARSRSDLAATTAPAPACQGLGYVSPPAETSRARAVAYVAAVSACTRSAPEAIVSLKWSVWATTS